MPSQVDTDNLELTALCSLRPQLCGYQVTRLRAYLLRPLGRWQADVASLYPVHISLARDPAWGNEK